MIVPADATASSGPEHPTARLRIDLDALAANWRALDARSAPSVTTAAVVKGDGYGLGLDRAAHALAGAGCDTFFVATPGEGATLRHAHPEAVIYVLDGLLPGAAGWMAERNLRPVLGSLPEIEEWRAARRAGIVTAAALHVDTGMNRLGLAPAELAALAGDDAALAETGADLVMSHLACADTPDHPASRDQLVLFRALRARFPGLRASLANSAGVLLGADYHFDLVRPGIALYGAAAAPGVEAPLAPVVACEARVLLVREGEEGQTVGYGAAETLKRPSRIAMLGAGYADGYHRAAGSTDAKPGARAAHRGRFAPLVGRVSMDLIAVDVTDLPDIERGDWIELFGPNVPVDEVAGHAGTIGYEFLTGLGRRYARVYGPLDPVA